MQLDTRFHIASMTKPITAVAAMILVEEGRLSLDDPVSRYLPAFASLEVALDPSDRRPDATRPLDTPLRVRHLITLQSGIGGYAETDNAFDRAWRSPDIEAPALGSLADRVALVPRLPLYEAPGVRWRYGWSFDVLARVVEVASGRAFDAFLEERIFEPLGMDSTGYPDALPPDVRLATLYTHDGSGALIAETRLAPIYGRGWTSGGGGLVSTAPDYMRFALMLAGGGSLDGVRILDPETVAEMTRLQVPSGVLEDMGIEGLGWGLGVSVVADGEAAIMPANTGDYWWSGRFGTHFWISPAKRTVVVVMQSTEPGPHTDRPISSALVQALAME